MSSDGRMVFVGNLPLDIRERELDDLFYKYGKILRIDLKTPARPPAYAFIEYDDSRDALDAVRSRDGHEFYNYKLRVEIAHGGTRSSRGGGGGGGGRDGGGGRPYDSHVEMSYPRRNRSGRGPPAHYFGPTHRSDYRVIVTNLPGSCSWQDLKDHMRKGGEVTFAQVFKERGGMMGVVDYATFEEMKAAIRKLDDSVFENPFDKCYIRVKEEKRRSMSRSRSRGSRSRSPRRSISRSRSRSPMDRSPYGKRSPSPARRSPSPRRSGSPYGRRSASPKRRSTSPKRSPGGRRSSSPRDRDRDAADMNGDAGRDERRDNDGDDNMGRGEEEERRD
eukprot:TRINITY_DN629_c0_g1_i1.p1 TRINITY_DN629_c0_g1~~TRINITY_DN629_c0_g1_i1.p1  ORF type:complete len:333 (-),score=55.61 TRINITY_DN629_c0_g1_i1:280-1278(-)